MTKKKKKSITVNNNIESEYYEDVKLVDPLTKKVTIIKVKIVRYSPKASAPFEEDEEEVIEVVDKLNESVNFLPIIDVDK